MKYTPDWCQFANLDASIKNVNINLKRGGKGKQRMQTSNNFSFDTAIAYVQLNQFHD